jgi:acetyl esterase/lipase
VTHELTRRGLIGSAVAAAAAIPAFAQDRRSQADAFPAAGPELTGTPQRPVVIPAPDEPAGLLSKEVVELWPKGKVPGAAGLAIRRMVLERGSPAAHDRAVMHVARPILEVFRPAEPNGAAMIVFPGGAYVRLAVDKEGAGSARHLAGLGVTTFVLNYRLPSDHWPAGPDVALQDAQRAIRLVRANAAHWGIDPLRIGVMGFSAGGHLAAALLTRYPAKTYDPVDAADRQSARPDMCVLAYAAMALGNWPDGRVRPPNELVAEGMAPTFVFQAADDKTVPMANSLSIFSALQAAKIPSELHIYQEGGHGFGFSLPPALPASRWPQDWEAWARRLGFMGRA